MKSHKNFAIILFVALSIFICSCTKEDVKINNRNINKYLPGQWKVITIDGQTPQEYGDLLLGFDDNGNVTTTERYEDGSYITYGGEATWSFNDENDRLTITNEYMDNGYTYSYNYDFDIIRLGKSNLEIMEVNEETLWVLEKE